jgi:hypothetical protein
LSSVAPIALLLTLPASSRSSVLAHLAAGTSFVDRPLAIPLVAADRPVQLRVFLCAFIARPGLSLIDQLREEPEIFASGFTAHLARDDAGRTYGPDAGAAIETF